jgi:hypothetical protein
VAAGPHDDRERRRVVADGDLTAAARTVFVNRRTLRDLHRYRDIERDGLVAPIPISACSTTTRLADQADERQTVRAASADEAQHQTVHHLLNTANDVLSCSWRC